nr:hypothetical protein [uncultured Brevundimonas sp.]
MAGLLFFSARSLDRCARFEILSDDARTLLGTIYLPNAELHIDAGQSDCRPSLPIRRSCGRYHAALRRAAPDLEYTLQHETPVPVPGGIKGVGQPITLVE